MELARQKLPIFLFKNQLLQTIRDNIVTIVVGEPGSGKTTQLPQYLHEVGYTASGKVMVTQPRRVAAMSVAKRVAEEMGVNLGAEVGYSIRFDTRVSDSTAIVYATDGILLQQFTHDPTLMAYCAIMVDEAHERSLNTDVLLAFLKDLALFRNGSLRLVIASATLNAQMFSDFFGGAPIFRIPNRCHPVRVFHTKFGVSNYVECSANTAVQLHLSRPLPGDVLIFLPGQQEILACCERVRELLEETGGAAAQASVLLVPFYSALSQDEQRTVFCKTPKNRRKIVVATNVAETSITIEGVLYVIDSGLVKQSFYDAKSGMEWLKVVSCSRASCVQRAGRAGRTQAGFCLRLFPKKTFDEELEASNPAEITCSNLTGLVLRLKHLGIDDVLNFDYVEAPPTLLLENALNNLFALQLIDAAGALTAAGATAALLPCSAQNAAAVLASCEYNCTNEVCMIVALLELEAGVLLSQPVHPALLRENLGDFMLQLAIFRGYIAAHESPQWCADHGIDERGMLRARNIHLQLTALLPTLGLPVRSSESVVDVLKSLLRGYFCNLAKSNGNRSYTLVQNREVIAQLHPASALLCRRRGKDATQSFFRVQALPKLVMFKELVFTKKQFLRGLMPVDPEWVREVAPEYFE
uniref:RNA helicase n=1 Tax=Dermatophagoides pteronyssinus TaxID=6956 RepID=A0A6P6YJK6_DERPT